MRVRFPALLAAVPLSALILLAACGKDETQENVEYTSGNSGPGVTVTVPSYPRVSSATPQGTRAATTTTGASVTATAATSASPIAAATGAAASGGNGGASGRTVNLTARDNSFDPKDWTIQNQETVRLNFDNKGSALHNFHVTSVVGADGKDIKIDLVPGGQSTQLTFTIALRGTYRYICDVFPAEMTGTLNVQ